ncbi:MAG: hypothetical protein HQK75_05625 [Candidatus Magnetomorum sp.]|nr:hypothetical protein [Candidatus Magnetomorum sp.]
MNNEQKIELLENHVQFELDRLMGEGYKQTIEEEISAAFEWFNKIQLQDLVTSEQIIELIRRIVIEAPVSGGITELAGEMSRNVLTSLQNQKTLLEDIFAQKQFDEIIDKAAILKKARNEIINRVMGSATYAKLITNIVYTGIKGYLLMENIIPKQIPIIPGLVKKGLDIVNNVIPLLTVLEAAIDHRLKTYIENNIEKMVRRSKLFLIEFLDDNQILETGDEIWEAIAKNPLSEYFSNIDSNDMEDFIIIGFEFWFHFRRTPYFEEISKELVQYFFKKYGNEYLDVLLDDLGVTKEMIIYEIIEMLSPAIQTLLSTGYLEERIRARLSAFYLS